MGIMKRKSYYISLTLVAFCFMVAPVAASRDFVAAGIALVAKEEQSALIFLVKHHSRSWYEMPGGRRQMVEDARIERGKRSETAYETAIRECYEESGGFLSPEFLRRIVDPSRMMRDGGFVFFVAITDWFALSDLPGAADSGHENAHAFREIERYAWVPVKNVLASENATVVDADGRSLEVRRELKSRLMRAREAGWL
ncbi:MAG: NUDIX hydrolase [Burkholderiales bacterium]